jgi:hypothetical protein
MRDEAAREPDHRMMRSTLGARLAVSSSKTIDKAHGLARRIAQRWRALLCNPGAQAAASLSSGGSGRRTARMAHERASERSRRYVRAGKWPDFPN